jgi:mRNA-degrading endonuclease RelE of RelBE toxin-antitoxin system
VIYKIDDERKEVVVGKVARRREDTYRAIEDLFWAGL